MQSQMQVLINAIGNIDQPSKRELAKQLIDDGIYKASNKIN
jgi:hypothetical protein